jgi:hypothetical protein
MHTLVTLPNSTVVGEVDVYRDGDAIIVIGKGSIEHDTPYGRIQSVGQGMSRFENVEAFEFVRNRAKAALAKKLEAKHGLLGRLLYTNLCDKFDLDRDVATAPQLPFHLGERILPLLTGGG